MTTSQAQNIVQYPWFPKTDPPLSGGAKAGEWQIRGKQQLGSIANNLVYEASNSRINSLPSPWSRALQFEQAILNPNYPTRESLLEEWFGGMACLGLWDMFGLKMMCRSVTLKDYAGVDDDSVGPFTRSLISSLPDGSSSLSRHSEGSNPWSVIHVFHLQGVIVGFSSPSTLLCPAVHLPQPIHGMGWTSSGKLSSPLDYLGTSQRIALANWFSYVSTGVSKAPDLNSLNSDSANELSTVLEDFIKRLNGGISVSPRVHDYVSDVVRILDLPPTSGALSLLSRPAKGPDNPSQTTIVLGDRQRRRVPEWAPADQQKETKSPGTPGEENQEPLPVIFVDSEMPSKLGVNAADICLYKSATLESIGYDSARLEGQYGAEIRVLTPDQIFLDELYLLPGEQALTNSWLPSKLEGIPKVNGDAVTPLLPFSPRIRHLFSSRELQERCMLRLLHTGMGVEVEVRLNLPLEGFDDGYCISRSFPLKEENVITDNVPVITLWPYVSDENWKLFYLFCEDSLSQLTIDAFDDYDILGFENNLPVKYFTTPHFPDLIRLSERGHHRGLLPVIPPESSRASGTSTWRVGFDFGTSFTNFFIDKGNGPERLQLDSRVVSVTSSQRETRQRLLSMFFIPEQFMPGPDEGGNPPLTTAISINRALGDIGKTPDVFHEARIWNAAPLDFNTGNICTGFKWTNRMLQKPFLKEVALLISANAAAEGVKEVDWSISYPSAFSSGEIALYMEVWNDIHLDLQQVTGVGQRLCDDNPGVGFRTEAVAFASYFRNFLKRQMVHTSCMDVGGGTTDISIWQNNKLIHQVSVPYAGFHISSQNLKRKPSFVSILFSGFNEATAPQNPNIISLLDLWMRFGTDNLLKDRLGNLASKHSSVRAPVCQFISLISVGFAGLYYYLGLVQRALRSEGKIKDNTPTPVYLGGNGGRLVNWIEISQRYRLGGDIDNLFAQLQVRASGCEPAAATTILSDAFKDETACGLISEGINLIGGFKPENDPFISGISQRINTTNFSDDDRVILPSSAEKSIDTYEITSLAPLKQFVSDYDASLSVLGIKHLLPINELCDLNSIWPEIEIEVKSLCLAKVGIKSSELEPEPGFIIALRAFTDTLGRLWAERF